jgi:hypothetical protein
MTKRELGNSEFGIRNLDFDLTGEAIKETRRSGSSRIPTTAT